MTDEQHSHRRAGRPYWVLTCGSRYLEVPATVLAPWPSRPSSSYIAVYLGLISGPTAIAQTTLLLQILSMRLSVLATGLIIALATNHVAADPAGRLSSRALLEDERNTVEVFRDVSPSVVYVVNRVVQRDIFSGRSNEFSRGTGSGFIWDAQGHIVTNFHVVSGSSSISVVLDNREFSRSSASRARREEGA